jgi:transposase
MTDPIPGIYGGVDTHRDFHVAAIVDHLGRILATKAFAATGRGYRQLLAWMRAQGLLVRVGVEGTGAYGAGLARYLTAVGVGVVEVNRPNRQARRRRGKNDTVDAEAAARAVLNGEAAGVPKAQDGIVESIRVLRIAFRSARDTRTRLANQIRDLVLTAPDQLRKVLGPIETAERVAIAARYRPGTDLADPLEATKKTLRSLARRYQTLTVELDDLRSDLDELTARANPALRAAAGVGVDVASILLIAAGDNPDRLRSDAAFAALCGASPVEASSGKTTRHRLNQGGNRQANHALWRIVMVRLTCHEPTRIYAARRRAEGKTSREIIRYLKRYVAREIHRLLTDPPDITLTSDLRPARLATGISLNHAARQLGVAPSRLSELERGTRRPAELETRYRNWLQEVA